MHSTSLGYDRRTAEQSPRVRAKDTGTQRRSRRLRTAVVLLSATVATVIVVVLVAWWVAQSRETPEVLGPTGLPTTTIILAVAGMLALLVMGIAIVELVATVPLAQSLLISADGRVFDPRPGLRVTVIIPAHDEDAALPGTLSSLANQTHPPERILVIADNCSDATADVAHNAGCLVLETSGNRGRKAGALNQGLARVLPGCDARDLLLIMDADTHLSPTFIEQAMSVLSQDAEMVAAGGIFAGDSRRGVLAQLQRNEFYRYARQITARRGRASVLTGTATVFRASALEAVAHHRGRTLPGVQGQVYDERSITEDNELTLALKSLGAHVLSPAGCRVTTETMPTLSALWVQRMRWQLGALHNISDYGLRASTFRYWLQQWGIAYGTVALTTSLVALGTIPLITGSSAVLPFWLVVAAAFAAERTVTAWESGWRGRFLAMTLIPEILYDLFIQANFVVAVLSLPRSQSVAWGHVKTTPQQAVGVP